MLLRANSLVIYDCLMFYSELNILHTNYTEKLYKYDLIQKMVLGNKL